MLVAHRKRHENHLRQLIENAGSKHPNLSETFSNRKQRCCLQPQSMISFANEVGLSSCCTCVCDSSIWAAAWQNKQNDIHPTSLIGVFAVRLKKTWVLIYPMSTQWRQIRLGGCPGWSQSSLDAQVILLVLSWCGLFNNQFPRQVIPLSRKEDFNRYWKSQEEPQSQIAANLRHQEYEQSRQTTNKIKPQTR